MRRELQKSISKRVAPTQLCLSSIFYNKIEFQIDVDLIRIIKISPMYTRKIVIDLQIEPSFKKRPSANKSKYRR